MRPRPSYPDSLPTTRLDSVATVGEGGELTPFGEHAQRELKAHAGPMVWTPCPPHVLLLRRPPQPGDERRGPADSGNAWLTGEVTRPGVLWEILSMLAQSRRVGEFVVDDGTDRRHLFLELGHLVGAASSAAAERIGGTLFRYGLLAADQAAQVARAATAGKRFGEAAVELGFVDRATLRQMMDKQSEEIFYSAMAATGGSFYFVAGLDETRIDHRAALPVQSLLLEGVRRLDEMDHFRLLIPSSQYVPLRIGLPQQLREVRSDEGAVKVLAAVDGASSIAEIARRIGTNEFEASRAVCELIRRKVVVLRPPRLEGLIDIVAVWNRALRLIHEALEGLPGAPDVRENLASFARGGDAYPALLHDAGPTEDGSFDAAVVRENAEGQELSDEKVAELLYEYASFAMFVAEPAIRGVSRPDATRVARKVGEYLKQIDPANWRGG
ncbi:MAG: DUF4388 domain-containing protein [Polyangiaceae bacterium]|nr:DUF4388 domain-containing protein [Polyangiaceae bacterium]